MATSTPALVTTLGALVGEQHVRSATSEDSVAGMTPGAVVAPVDETAVAAVLAFATSEGLKILLRGGGTQLGLGFPPTGGDVVLSLSNMRAVVEHNPQDLTATLQAGLPLAEAQRMLGAHRQWLALDPMLPPEATIGGVVATNATGARRLRYGGVRDQLIGVRVVLADGTIAKGGGKVVKNVAGYDLPKLYTGALGTLGVVVAATFRLYPLAAASRTVRVTDPQPAPLCALAVRTLATTLVPTALDVVGPASESDTSALLARFESTAEAVEDQAARFVELAGASGLSSRVLAAEEETEAWRPAHAPGADTDDTRLTVKANLLPTAVAAWLDSLRVQAAQSGLEARWRAHAGHGIVQARLTGAASALAASVDSLRSAAAEQGGSLVVLDAPLAVAGQVDVWGPSPALDLMRRLKASFDPHSTLNPGRFIGRV